MCVFFNRLLPSNSRCHTLTARDAYILQLYSGVVFVACSVNFSCDSTKINKISVWKLCRFSFSTFSTVNQIYDVPTIILSVLLVVFASWFHRHFYHFVAQETKQKVSRNVWFGNVYAVCVFCFVLTLTHTRTPSRECEKEINDRYMTWKRSL